VVTGRSRGGRYRSYWCSNARKGRAFCQYYNGHATQKLENVILEYLSEFSDPELVRDHMEAAERKEFETKEAELDQVTRGIVELESQFLKHLDLLKREVLTEEEFTKANGFIRSQRDALEERHHELKSWVDDQRQKVSHAERMPDAIKSFLEDFEALDVKIQKAKLQTILKAAYVYRDNSIEIEFRG